MAWPYKLKIEQVFQKTVTLVTQDNPQTSLEQLSTENTVYFCNLAPLKGERDWGLDVWGGGFGMKPRHRWSHGYSKADVNTMTDISHPLTFPVITTTMCVGAESFSLRRSFPGEDENHALLQSLPSGGSSCSPTLIFILVTLGRLSLFSWGGNYTPVVVFGGVLTYGNRRASITVCSAF